MQQNKSNGRGSRGLLLTRLSMAALLSAPVLTGCDLEELLEIDDEFTVTTATAQDTANLDNTFAGVKSSFGTAVGGYSNNYLGIVQTTGLAGDELYAADNFTTRLNLETRNYDYELSNIEDEPFEFLQRARAEALAAAGLFAQTSQANSARHAELYNIAGYSTVMLAENYCSGVPLSRVDGNGNFVYGAQLTQNQAYDAAIAFFDSAAATATNSDRQRHVALIGKARAQLDKGDFPAAAATAAQVPSTFTPYLVEYDAGSDRSENAIWQFNFEEGRIGASNMEGTLTRGLPYGTAVDPRTPISATTRAANSGTFPVFIQQKYANGSADVPLASAYEARYIQAEAALRAGNVAQYETFMTQARAIQGLPALSSAEMGTTPASRVDALFRERAYAMWLTGHRFSDMRRLVRQYSRTISSVFPTGTTLSNRTYETDEVPFPIQFEEVNNPNYKGCLDTNA